MTRVNQGYPPRLWRVALVRMRTRRAQIDADGRMIAGPKFERPVSIVRRSRTPVAVRIDGPEFIDMVRRAAEWRCSEKTMGDTIASKKLCIRGQRYRVRRSG